MTALRDRAAFRSAYDAAMRRWPPGTEAADLPSEFGLTRVYSCGPAQGRPVVLLSAYGATSLEWNALAHDLAADHRVHAVDIPGDPGGSVADGTPIDTPERMRTWLTGVLDGCAGRPRTWSVTPTGRGSPSTWPCTDPVTGHRAGRRGCPA